VGEQTVKDYLRWTVQAAAVLALLQTSARGAEGKVKLVLPTGHTSMVTAVALSADGRRALTGSADSTAILWDTDSGQKLQTFQVHSVVFAVALSTDGQRVLTGSTDST